MSLKNQIAANFNLVFTKDVRDILVDGILQGIAIHKEGLKADRERLGYYASNKETRDIFSSFCRGLETAITDSKSLLLRSEQRQITSSYFIEISNPNIIMHVRNENSSFPKYMKDMCKLNDTFEIGKKNYCTLSFTGQNGEIVNSIDIVVYDTLGEIAYKEKLADIFTNIKVA